MKAKTLKIYWRMIWRVFCEPYRQLNNFMFGDAHHIVSRKGREILKKYDDDEHD